MQGKALQPGQRGLARPEVVQGQAASEAGELAEGPAGEATFGALPAGAVEPKSYTAWKREFVDWVTRTRSLTIWKSPSLGEVSRPDEDEREFRIRLQQHARERRDAERTKLEEKYGARTARLEERIRKAEQTVAREEEQARQAKLQTAVSIGATVLGTLFGRRALGRATTAARGVGRSMDQAGDVGRAEENVARLREERHQRGDEDGERDATRRRAEPRHLARPRTSARRRGRPSDVV